MATLQKITPFLTFNNQAEEAIALYCSVFADAKPGRASHLPDGSFLTGTFSVGEQTFYVLNAGPTFSFSLGISLFIHCDTQAEVDHFWEKLAADGGKHLDCGWLQDRFGVAWQVVPTQMGALLSDPDRVKAGRAMQAMMTMQKLDIAALQAAFDGE